MPAWLEGFLAPWQSGAGLILAAMLLASLWQATVVSRAKLTLTVALLGLAAAFFLSHAPLGVRLHHHLGASLLLASAALLLLHLRRPQHPTLALVGAGTWTLTWAYAWVAAAAPARPWLAQAGSLSAFALMVVLLWWLQRRGGHGRGPRALRALGAVACGAMALGLVALGAARFAGGEHLLEIGRAHV